MSVWNTGKPTTNAEDVTYCEISDVKKYLRSYGFSPSDLVDESSVNDLIADKTREIEKQIMTAFRELRIEDVSADAYPTKSQQQSNLVRRSVARSRSGNVVAPYTSEKWVKIQLPHRFIDTVEEIKAKTAQDADGNVVDPDDYTVNERSGTLRVRYTEFESTVNGKAGDNRLKDSRISATYTYNYGRIEEDIKEACAKLVVYDIVTSDAYADVLPDEIDTVEPDEISERFKEDAEDIINQYS